MVEEGREIKWNDSLFILKYLYCDKITLNGSKLIHIPSHEKLPNVIASRLHIV